MADSSCSHWFHAPFYLAAALAFALISLTTVNHTSPENSTPPLQSLALNVSQALRRHGGFGITASLIQISPDLFFPGHESTIFAIQDTAISNLSIPASEMRWLLRYHTASSSLTMADLVSKPPGFCLSENLVITKKNSKIGSITINHVLISHPDMFLQGPISVHGVLQPFPQIPPPQCLFPDQSPSDTPHRRIEWTKIIRFLSTKGFTSFAIGLNAEIDGILDEYKNLTSATIFAPPDSHSAAAASPMMSKIVRIHIVPGRFSERDLLKAANSSLRTLVRGYKLKIERYSRTLEINGAGLISPDMFCHENFVVHAISEDFISDSLSISY